MRLKLIAALELLSIWVVSSGRQRFRWPKGLLLNSKAGQKHIHAYDLFTWDEFYEAWAKGEEVEGLFTVGGSFLPEFLRRTQRWARLISSCMRKI